MEGSLHALRPFCFAGTFPSRATGFGFKGKPRSFLLWLVLSSTKVNVNNINEFVKFEIENKVHLMNLNGLNLMIVMNLKIISVI